MCPTESEVGKIPSGQVYLTVLVEGRNSYLGVPVALLLFVVATKQSLLGQVTEIRNKVDEKQVADCCFTVSFTKKFKGRT